MRMTVSSKKRWVTHHGDRAAEVLHTTFEVIPPEGDLRQLRPSHDDGFTRSLNLFGGGAGLEKFSEGCDAGGGVFDRQYLCDQIARPGKRFCDAGGRVIDRRV